MDRWMGLWWWVDGWISLWMVGYVGLIGLTWAKQGGLTADYQG